MKYFQGTAHLMNDEFFNPLRTKKNVGPPFVLFKIKVKAKNNFDSYIQIQKRVKKVKRRLAVFTDVKPLKTN